MFPPRLARLVGLPNGRAAADGRTRRTDDGRVVRDLKPEPTTREVQSRKAVPRVVYWFERGVFLVLTGMPRPVLGELNKFMHLMMKYDFSKLNFLLLFQYHIDVKFLLKGMSTSDIDKT